VIAKDAGNEYNQCMQYTIRKIPDGLDAEIRRRAKLENRSLNEIAVQAMKRGMGMAGGPARQRDLAGLAGRWRDDPEFDAAIVDQDSIDPELWS
jgi:hypothetical protein